MSLLTIENLSKTFPGQRALDAVALEVEEGEIHALVGQNGSGKTTIIKVLARYHEPDPGARIVALGRELASYSLHDMPVRFIHQDLGLVPTLGAVENLALGRGFVRGRLGRIRWARQAAVARRAIAAIGMSFDVTMPVGALSPSERTTVAIARAMLDLPATGLLILDEPTASLPITEVQRLFEVMRAVADNGSGVLFVSHRIDEVLNIADRVTVLRDGRVVAVERVDALDHDTVVELITGRKVDRLYPRLPDPRDDVVLAVRGLHGGRLRDLSFDVRRSEILGVAGITGSGREDVASLVFGAIPATAGSVKLGGRAIRPATPRTALEHGMALVPADRMTRGLIPAHSVRENLTLSRLRPFVRFGVLRRRAERCETDDWIQRLSISPPEPELALGVLSGGNQQKTMLARSLRLSPEALILDEPTHGVDVGAKATIYTAVAQLAERGAAVVICSSDAEELAHLCDRVVVLRNGRIVADLAGADLSPHAITGVSLRADTCSVTAGAEERR